jgi:hypothetical protein
MDGLGEGIAHPAPKIVLVWDRMDARKESLARGAVRGQTPRWSGGVEGVEGGGVERRGGGSGAGGAGAARKL